MKKVTSFFVAIAVILGGVITSPSASACGDGSCGVSESHGYYKKTIIKRTRTIRRSCTTSNCFVAPSCSGGCRYRSFRPFYAGYGTRFTGGPLQFRWGQPIRNILRFPARLGVRAASLVGGALRGVGRILFPRRFF